MRRIGLFGDIHGNLPALDAVLSELESQADELVCLGDVAAGPQPRETLARVKELGCPVVLGNWDAWFVSGIPQLDGDVGSKLAEIGEFQAAQLTDEDRTYTESFTPLHEIALDSTVLLCYHGSPRSFEDWILPTTTEEELEPMLDGRRAPLMAGGHTHVQMLRRLGRDAIVNPGAVGLPFLQWRPKPVRVAPWAEYGILSVDGKRVSLDLRRTTYDVEGLLSFARESGMPHADWWIGTWATDLA